MYERGGALMPEASSHLVPRAVAAACDEAAVSTNVGSFQVKCEGDTRGLMMALPVVWYRLVQLVQAGISCRSSVSLSEQRVSGQQ